MSSLKDRVIIVTGASAGIGSVVARRLAAEGATVVAAARNESRLRQLAEEIGKNGGRAEVVSTDVCDTAALRNLVSQTLERLGRIDVLVNNAGVECFDEFERLSEAQIVQTVNTNLTSALLLTRLVIPHMLNQQSGAIINMASTAGKLCPAYETVYGSTKAALIAFTQGLRGEYLDRGISATAICPGFTRKGGMYDRMVAAYGKPAPRAVGSTTAEAVADAVLRGILRKKPEIIVNSTPIRPAIVLASLFPSLGEKLVAAVTKKFIHNAVKAGHTETPEVS